MTRGATVGQPYKRVPPHLPITCEDCGDEMQHGHRRTRCPRCGLLVCCWCRHHAHALAIYKDKFCGAKAEGKATR
jgi:hypothetical protein